MTSVKLTIPCHWDRGVIDKILTQNKSALVGVAEVYGVLAEGGPVGHGRTRDTVKKISKQEAVNFRNYLKDSGLKFTYLLNAPFQLKNNRNLNLNNYLRWVLEEMRPDALTVSSLDLMEHIRKIDSRIKIYISTIAGIKSIEDLKPFLRIKPSRVILHHDVGKKWNDLKKIAKYSKENSVSVEIMVTESCLFMCSNRKEHYEYLAKENKDSPFHYNCNLRKLNYPREYLLAGGIVRPEDLSFYEEMGVNYFKISGRSQFANWLPEVVKAYQNRNYQGNLIRLLDIDPTMKAHQVIYLDNKSLDKFLKNLPQTGYQDAIRYCDNWMISLYHKNKFKVFDRSVYSTKNNVLFLEKAGDHLARFINR